MAASYQLQLSPQQKEIIRQVATELREQAHPTLKLGLLCQLSFEAGQQDWFREPARWRKQELEPTILPVAYLFVLAEAWVEVQALVEEHSLTIEHLEALACWCLSDRYRTGFDWLADTYGIDTYLPIERAFIANRIRGDDISQELFLMSLREEYGDEVQQALEINKRGYSSELLRPSSSDQELAWDTDY